MTVHTKFTVTGRGSFPTDMLRYDNAYPYDQQAVIDLESAIRGKGLNHYCVTLVTQLRDGPTAARWNSFLAAIENIGSC